MRARIAICGAGIAGIATAYYLAKKYAQEDVVLIDKRLPLSLTTSKSGENFRKYWPDRWMAGLVGRSLELMEDLAKEHSEAFSLRFSGYEFVSESKEHRLFPSSDSEGLEVLTAELRASRPYLGTCIEQLVRVNCAGDFSVHGLGTLLLSLAQGEGVQLLPACVQGLDKRADEVRLDLGEAGDLAAERLVLAPGPFLGELGEMLGLELPVECFLQQKFVVPDPHGVIPRDMPFTIFADPQYLPWSTQERELLTQDPSYAWLTEELPGGLHIKPEGSNQIKLGWAFNRRAEQPLWNPQGDPDFPRVAMRGASRFIPGLSAYVDALPTPVVSYAGYYTRTKENWPLVGPTSLDGVYTVGALSGYGTMAACGAGELCADWMCEGTLPEYARYFQPLRYDDEVVQRELEQTQFDGQL